MIDRTVLGLLLLPVSLVASFSGCRTNEVSCDGTAYPRPVDRQPTASVEQPSSEIADPWAERPMIRPGHSLDVDTWATSPSPSAPAEPPQAVWTRPPDLVEEPPIEAENAAEEFATDTDHRSRMNSEYEGRVDYMVPPPPTPPWDEDGSFDRDGNAAPFKSAPTPPIGSDDPEQDRSTSDAGVSVSEPSSPDLASPFSIRGLYQRLRGSKETKTDGHTPATSAHVCEYNEAATDVPRAVSLSRPEPAGGSSEPGTRQQTSAVMQACPSCFQGPMWAEPPGRRTLVLE